MKRKIVAGLLCLATLSSCAPGQGNDRQTAGTVLGGVLGALVGSQFGRGDGRLVGVALGALAGAYIGNQVGASLDRSDRAEVERTSTRALSEADDGQRIRWNNPESGASAVMVPGNSHVEEHHVSLVRDRRIQAVPPLRIIGETWRATGQATVRAAPSATARTVFTLQPGDTFNAVGQVQDSDWIVVAYGNRTVGYVRGAEVERSPTQPLNHAAAERDRSAEADAEHLVTQQVAAAVPCRSMDIAVTAGDGSRESDQVNACRRSDGGWETTKR